MKKFSLKEWAAFSEIIAAVAVIISLVFVVISINRNTTEMQAQNINDLYDSLREIEMTVLADPDLAEIVRKVEDGKFDDLNDNEAFRYTAYMVQHLSIWEQMHGRKSDGPLLFVMRDSRRCLERLFHQRLAVLLPDETPQNLRSTRLLLRPGKVEHPRP